MNFISTHDQLADIFTNGLSSPKLLALASKLLGVPPSSLRGDVKQGTATKATESSQVEEISKTTCSSVID